MIKFTQLKIPADAGLLLSRAFQLLDSDFGAADALAGEAAELAGREGYDAVAGSVNGVVGAQLGTFTGALGQADLADDDLAGFTFWPPKSLTPRR